MLVKGILDIVSWIYIASYMVCEACYSFDEDINYVAAIQLLLAVKCNSYSCLSDT